jgi:hypothetical protein
MQEAGWQAILDNFKNYAETNGGNRGENHGSLTG